MFLKKNPNLFDIKHNTYVNSSLRPRNNIPIPRHSTAFFKKHIRYACIKLYNSLPIFLKNITCTIRFRNKLKEYLVDNEFYSVHDYLQNN